jgi:hypothetical protein
MMIKIISIRLTSIYKRQRFDKPYKFEK